MKLKYVFAVMAISASCLYGGIYNGICLHRKTDFPYKSGDTLWYSMPGFLNNGDKGFLNPYHHGDTEFHYEFFGSRDSLIDDQIDPDEVGFISVIKSYTDSATTFINSKGIKQFLPISIITIRYDRIDANLWKEVDYRTNRFSIMKTNCNAHNAIDPIDISIQNAGTDSMHIIRYIFCNTTEE